MNLLPQGQRREQGVVLARAQGRLRHRENIGGQRGRLVGPEQSAEVVGRDGQLGAGEVADIAVKGLLLESEVGARAHEQSPLNEHVDSNIDEPHAGRKHLPREELEHGL